MTSHEDLLHVREEAAELRARLKKSRDGFKRVDQGTLAALSASRGALTTSRHLAALVPRLSAPETAAATAADGGPTTAANPAAADSGSTSTHPVSLAGLKLLNQAREVSFPTVATVAGAGVALKSLGVTSKAALAGMAGVALLTISTGAEMAVEDEHIVKAAKSFAEDTHGHRAVMTACTNECMSIIDDVDTFLVSHNDPADVVSKHVLQYRHKLVDIKGKALKEATLESSTAKQAMESPGVKFKTPAPPKLSTHGGATPNNPNRLATTEMLEFAALRADDGAKSFEAKAVKYQTAMAITAASSLALALTGSAVAGAIVTTPWAAVVGVLSGAVYGYINDSRLGWSERTKIYGAAWQKLAKIALDARHAKSVVGDPDQKVAEFLKFRNDTQSVFDATNKAWDEMNKKEFERRAGVGAQE